ncbi:hypothetical protein INT46_001401 [Mucor plumbeus]|uniref:Uncharacterized protein n=1 Tax=Mucor plumbeus TaxID=97098 RepID=A0A8H7VGC5_9FUNG|nr:hypothetical protein INT46_001401 [Mucor plumbeus]
METEFFGSATDGFQLIDPIQQAVTNINESKVVKCWVDIEDYNLQGLNDNQVVEALVKIKREKEEEEEIAKKIDSVSDNTGLIDETSVIFSYLTITDHNQNDQNDQIDEIDEIDEIDQIDEIDEIDEMQRDLITKIADDIAALSLSTENEIDFDNLAVFNEKGEIIVEDFSLFEFFSKYLIVKKEFYEQRVTGLEKFIMPCSFENSNVLKE